MRERERERERERGRKDEWTAHTERRPLVLAADRNVSREVEKERDLPERGGEGRRRTGTR